MTKITITLLTARAIDHNTETKRNYKVKTKRDELMSTTELSEFVKRTPGGIRNLVLRRRIPYRKVEGRLVFLRSEIEAWIENSPGNRLSQMTKKESYQEDFKNAHEK
jgi:hypothetical protein